MSEYAVEESLREDGTERCEQFEEWGAFSSVQWKDDNKDSTCFADWTSFNRSLSEEAESAHPSPQKDLTSDHKHKVQWGNEVNPWIVFHDCFHAEEMEKDTDMNEILPLAQLLHNSTRTPPQPTGVSREGTNIYYRLLCEPESGPKPILHSHKILTDTLQLKQPDTHTLQNPDFPDLGFEVPENSSAALIQTKLTAHMWSRNTPGFLYQISRQWFNQYSMRLQNHQDKKNLQ